MAQKLAPIKDSTVQKLPYKVDVERALRTKMPVFTVKARRHVRSKGVGRMVDIEVALRKCRRLGVFRDS